MAFAADRLSKAWAAAYLTADNPVVISDFLSLRPVYNEGIAFGMLQGIGPAIGWLSILIVIGLLVYMQRLPHFMWLMRLGLALAIGGATGNLIDRITAGQVLDFIVTPLRPGIFNMADLLINGGVAISLVGALFQGRGKRADETEAQGEAELEEPAVR